MAKKKEKPKPLIVPPEIITAEEFKKRQEFYEDYYQKSRDTKAFKDYTKMRELVTSLQKSNWKPGDPPTETIKKIRKLREKCRKTLLEEKFELPRPNFEDPEIQKMKNELGVKEYWEEQIKIAQERGQEIIYLNDRVQDTLDLPTTPPTF